MLGDPKSSSDTNYLAQVAYWNEHGTDGKSSTVRVALQFKNGFRKTKAGNVRQKYRNRYYDKQEFTQSGRPPRPFVQSSVSAAIDHIHSNFSSAIMKAVSSALGKGGKASVGRAIEEIPF
jgi:hypothetical protein